MRFGVPGSARGYVPGKIVEEGEGWNIRKGSFYENFGDTEGEPSYVECGVCLGTGMKKIRKERPDTSGKVVVYGVDNMSFDDLVERVGDSPTDERTDDETSESNQ